MDLLGLILELYGGLPLCTHTLVRTKYTEMKRVTTTSGGSSQKDTFSELGLLYHDGVSGPRSLGDDESGLMSNSGLEEYPSKPCIEEAIARGFSKIGEMSDSETGLDRCVG